jgi:hypothetical protein
MSNQEQLELRRKWLEALRSGEFQQGTGALKRKIGSDRFEYCCLGVLCEITGDRDGWQVVMANTYSFHRVNGYLAPDIRKAVGLRYGDGQLPGGESLVQINDDRQMSFAEIADWIEKNASDLFVD